MVSVSREAATQTRTRLRAVLANAEIAVLEGAWSFVETPMDEPPRLDQHVLAVVRDGECWSSLRPDDGSGGQRERFGLLSFHFPPGLDNSGFVGWLATELKQRLGTGLFVVCGSNSGHGGIYDYWGCPVDLLDDVIGVIRELADPTAILRQGRSVIPKSTNPERIAQNLDVFDFTLSDDEMSRITALDTGMRTGPDPDEPRGDFYDRPIPEA